MLPLTTVMFSENNDTAPVHSSGRRREENKGVETIQTKCQAFLSAPRKWTGPQLTPCPQKVSPSFSS